MFVAIWKLATCSVCVSRDVKNGGLKHTWTSCLLDDFDRVVVHCCLKGMRDGSGREGGTSD